VANHSDQAQENATLRQQLAKAKTEIAWLKSELEVSRPDIHLRYQRDCREQREARLRIVNAKAQENT
jgi:hypothetical protein